MNYKLFLLLVAASFSIAWAAEEVVPEYPQLPKSVNAAVEADDVAEVQKYLDADPKNCNSVNEFNSCLLSHAMARFKGKDTQMIDIILNKNPKVNCRNEVGWSPLAHAIMSASKHLSLIPVQKLVAAGVNLQTRCVSSRNALGWAMSNDVFVAATQVTGNGKAVKVFSTTLVKYLTEQMAEDKKNQEIKAHYAKPETDLIPDFLPDLKQLVLDYIPVPKPADQ